MLGRAISEVGAAPGPPTPPGAPAPSGLYSGNRGSLFWRQKWVCGADPALCGGDRRALPSLWPVLQFLSALLHGKNAVPQRIKPMVLSQNT